MRTRRETSPTTRSPLLRDAGPFWESSHRSHGPGNHFLCLWARLPHLESDLRCSRGRAGWCFHRVERENGWESGGEREMRGKDRHGGGVPKKETKLWGQFWLVILKVRGHGRHESIAESLQIQHNCSLFTICVVLSQLLICLFLQLLRTCSPFLS